MIYVVAAVLSFANWVSVLILTRNLKLSVASLILSLPLGYLFDIQYRVFSSVHLLIIGLVITLTFKATFTPILVNKRIAYTCVGIFWIILLFLMTNSKITIEVAISETVLLVFFILAITMPVALSKDSTSEKQVLLILVFSVFCDFCLYLGLYFFEFTQPGIRGEYFQRTGLVRYADIFHLVNFMLASVLFFKSTTTKVLPVLLMIVISTISQERVLLIWSLGCAFGLMGKLNSPQKVIYFCFLSLLAIVIYEHVQNIGDGEFLQRMYELGNLELLTFALHHRFIEPVLQGGYILSASNILFGAGGNFSFYIPWFEYRGLNPEANSVDSFYITFFVKYGLFTMSFICYALVVFFRPLGVGCYWVPVYLAVQNGIYVPTFLILLMSIGFISSLVFVKGT